MKQLYFTFLLIFSCPGLYAQQTKAVLQNMYAAVTEIQTLNFQLVSSERLENGKFSDNIIDIQMRPKPLKIDITLVKPFEGAELHYDETTNPEKVLAIPPSWWLSWAKMNLNINGKLLRKDMHHSIRETGFDYFVEIIKNAEARAQEHGFNEVFQLEAGQVIDGHICHKIIIDDPVYEHQTYQVKAEENILTIAAGHYINEYKILELNPKIKGFKDVEPGQEIILPSSYGKHCVIWIDQQSYLPRQMEVSDEKGLYERYNFKNIIVNP